VERWSVKTGTDADEALIKLGSTMSTTIASLTSLTAPGSPPSNNRVCRRSRFWGLSVIT
jgi:hypothetical protein